MPYIARGAYVSTCDDDSVEERHGRAQPVSEMYYYIRTRLVLNNNANSQMHNTSVRVYCVRFRQVREPTTYPTYTGCFAESRPRPCCASLTNSLCLHQVPLLTRLKPEMTVYFCRHCCLILNQ